MPNASELARLGEELDYLRAELHGYKSKDVKKQILSEIRVIERQLGIESKPYNRDSF